MRGLAVWLGDLRRFAGYDVMAGSGEPVSFLGGAGHVAIQGKTLLKKSLGAWLAFSLSVLAFWAIRRVRGSRTRRTFRQRGVGQGRHQPHGDGFGVDERHECGARVWSSLKKFNVYNSASTVPVKFRLTPSFTSGDGNLYNALYVRIGTGNCTGDPAGHNAFPGTIYEGALERVRYQLDLGLDLRSRWAWPQHQRLLLVRVQAGGQRRQWTPEPVDELQDQCRRNPDPEPGLGAVRSTTRARGGAGLSPLRHTGERTSRAWRPRQPPPRTSGDLERLAALMSLAEESGATAATVYASRRSTSRPLRREVGAPVLTVALALLAALLLFVAYGTSVRDRWYRRRGDRGRRREPTSQVATRSS